jgi:hypothetical protein
MNRTGAFFSARDVGLRPSPQSDRVDEAAGAALAKFAPAGLADEELEQHIDDLAWSWRVAYDRYQRYGLPADRDEALLLLHIHNQAVLSRSPVAQAARWAEIDRSIDEGVGYFTSGAAQKLGRVSGA